VARKRTSSEQTASPQRNFTLTTAERVQAIVTGPPAWARRRKNIEDLSALILQAHRDGRESEVKRKLAQLVELVDHHNAYYPIEANLPLDPETSRLMDNGEPWRPMPRPTLESLLAAANPIDDEPVSFVWSDQPDALGVTFEAEGPDGAEERYTVTLDHEALTCKTARAGMCERVPAFSIEEIGGGDRLEVVTGDAHTVRFPFRLDEASIEILAKELGARLRAMRAALSSYRGDLDE
jgi:hypothetical protein